MTNDTDDIVQRLRAITWWGKSPPPFWPEITEAAAEIERLRANVQWLRADLQQQSFVIDSYRRDRET